MNVKAISFNKTGYDPFIDFLKAYSIICVVVAHILPADFYKYILFQVWGDMQVPMFVLIQVFHAYKKGIKPKLNWESLLKRIFIPFVAVQVVITGFKALMQGGAARNLLITSAIWGGYGPGSYYIWIYLQIAFLLVIIWPWMRKMSIRQAILVFLIISVGFEILFSVIDLPDWLYRLLCVRYLFLIPLGMIWIEKGVELNSRNIVLSILSIFAVLFFVFTNYDLEPIFYNTGWDTHRWVCYFYLPILLTYVLFLVWNKIKNSSWIETVTKWTAARSYEIFLAQMAVFACFSTSVLAFVSNGLVRFAIWALLTFTLSLLFGGFIYWFRKSILKW